MLEKLKFAIFDRYIKETQYLQLKGSVLEFLKQWKGEAQK